MKSDSPEVRGNTAEVMRFAPSGNVRLLELAAATGLVAVITFFRTRRTSQTYADSYLRDPPGLVASDVLLTALVLGGIALVVLAWFGNRNITLTADGLSFCMWRTVAIPWSRVLGVRTLSGRVVITTTDSVWILPSTTGWIPPSDLRESVIRYWTDWVLRRDVPSVLAQAEPYVPSHNREGNPVLRSSASGFLSGTAGSFVFSLTMSNLIYQRTFDTSLAILLGGFAIATHAWWRRSRIELTNDHVVVYRWRIARIPRSEVFAISERRMWNSGTRQLVLNTRDRDWKVPIYTSMKTGWFADPRYYRKWQWLHEQLVDHH